MKNKMVFLFILFMNSLLNGDEVSVFKRSGIIIDIELSSYVPNGLVLDLNGDQISVNEDTKVWVGSSNAYQSINTLRPGQRIGSKNVGWTASELWLLEDPYNDLEMELAEAEFIWETLDYNPYKLLPHTRHTLDDMASPCYHCREEAKEDLRKKPEDKLIIILAYVLRTSKDAEMLKTANELLDEIYQRILRTELERSSSERENKEKSNSGNDEEYPL